mgnify:CR=1 FL=1
MTPKKRRLILYVCLYSVSCIIALVGLTYNIKSMTLNEEIKTLKQAIRDINRENDVLEMDVLKKTSLHTLDDIATTKLNMSAPKKINYVLIPSSALPN